MERFFDWVVDFGAPWKNGRGSMVVMFRLILLGVPVLLLGFGFFVGIRILTALFPAFFNILGYIVGAAVVSLLFGLLLYIIANQVSNK